MFKAVLLNPTQFSLTNILELPLDTTQNNMERPKDTPTQTVFTLCALNNADFWKKIIKLSFFQWKNLLTILDKVIIEDN